MRAGAPGGNVSDELTLDNKYYTARVRVSLATPQLLPDSAAVGDHEAQLLLFDATSEASFDAVRDWAHRSGCEEGGDCEPEIKLCVAAVTDALPRGTPCTPMRSALRLRSSIMSVSVVCVSCQPCRHSCSATWSAAMPGITHYASGLPRRRCGGAAAALAGGKQAVGLRQPVRVRRGHQRQHQCHKGNLARP